MTQRPVGLTRDAGWEIGVSRTVPFPIDDVWDFLTLGGCSWPAGRRTTGVDPAVKSVGAAYLLRLAEQASATTPDLRGLILAVRAQAATLVGTGPVGARCALDELKQFARSSGDSTAEGAWLLLNSRQSWIDGTVTDVAAARDAIADMATRMPRPDLQWWPLALDAGDRAGDRQRAGDRGHRRGGPHGAPPRRRGRRQHGARPAPPPAVRQRGVGRGGRGVRRAGDERGRLTAAAGGVRDGLRRGRPARCRGRCPRPVCPAPRSCSSGPG